MDINNLLNALDITRYQRGFLRPSVLLYPLIYSDIYLYAPAFRDFDLASRLLIAASVLSACALSVAFLVVCFERVARFRPRRAIPAFFFPSFLSFGFMVVMYAYLDSTSVALLMLSVIVFHVVAYLLFLFGALMFRSFCGKEDAVEKDREIGGRGETDNGGKN